MVLYRSLISVTAGAAALVVICLILRAPALFWVFLAVTLSLAGLTLLVSVLDFLNLVPHRVCQPRRTHVAGLTSTFVFSAIGIGFLWWAVVYETSGPYFAMGIGCIVLGIMFGLITTCWWLSGKLSKEFGLSENLSRLFAILATIVLIFSAAAAVVPNISYLTQRQEYGNRSHTWTTLTTQLSVNAVASFLLNAVRYLVLVLIAVGIFGLMDQASKKGSS